MVYHKLRHKLRYMVYHKLHYRLRHMDLHMCRYRLCHMVRHVLRHTAFGASLMFHVPTYVVLEAKPNVIVHIFDTSAPGWMSTNIQCLSCEEKFVIGPRWNADAAYVEASSLI